MSTTTQAPKLEIRRLNTQTMTVPILGMDLLVIHRFSEKAKETMRGIKGNKRPLREATDSRAEFEAARYRLEDGGDGFPAIGFKAAIVGAARYFSGVNMTDLRQTLFVHGETGPTGDQLVRIETENGPTMREDVVRLKGSATDLRYRPQYLNWRADLTVTWVTSMLSQEAVLSLIDAAGLGVGVGEWRPEKDGDWGRFQVDPDREVVAIPDVRAA